MQPTQCASHVDPPSSYSHSPLRARQPALERPAVSARRLSCFLRLTSPHSLRDRHPLLKPAVRLRATQPSTVRFCCPPSPAALFLIDSLFLVRAARLSNSPSLACIYFVLAHRHDRSSLCVAWPLGPCSAGRWRSVIGDPIIHAHHYFPAEYTLWSRRLMKRE